VRDEAQVWNGFWRKHQHGRGLHFEILSPFTFSSQTAIDGLEIICSVSYKPKMTHWDIVQR
jgi:hypothetical protein